MCVTVRPGNIHARLSSLAGSPPPFFSNLNDVKHVAGQTNWRAGSPEHMHIH